MQRLLYISGASPVP
jgi:hypothetical protein